MVNLRNWRVAGTRGSHAVARVVAADSHQAAIQRASKGRDFMLVTSCVLLDELSHVEIRDRAVRAHANLYRGV